jgi:hypothetical protein
MKPVSLTLLCLILLNASAGAKPPVERCVAAVCLRDPQLTEDVFVKRFGSGVASADRDEPGRHHHCFFLGPSSRWVRFTFEPDSPQRTAELVSILVSHVELCAPRVSPMEDVGLAATEDRIALGQTQADIERILGRPQRTDQVEKNAASIPAAVSDILYSARLGQTRLVYESENDTLFNFFYLMPSGKIGSIFLADTP